MSENVDDIILSKIQQLCKIFHLMYSMKSVSAGYKL